MSKKTVIVGMDGVPYGLVKDLADNGDMDNISCLISQGNFSKMRAAIPEVSNVNWSSIVTGKNPGEHGIYGFTELIQGTYTVRFPDRRALKASPFWDESDKRYVLLNVPAMYPAPQVNGIFVSGFVSLDMDKAVYPKSALELLNKIGYEIDVDSDTAHKSYKLFLDRLFSTLRAREKAYRYFWKEAWDIFMLVFTGSDRLEHFLWDAYEDPGDEHHMDFVKYYREMDRIVGDIMDKLDEDDDLILISDHGMEGIESNVNVNKILEDNGYLVMDEDRKGRYNNIRDETKAFAMDPGRIYVHHISRFPQGSVKDGDEVIPELIDLFQELKYDGKRVIKNVHRRDEIYNGSQVHLAPDLVLTPASGFNLKGGVKYEETYEKNIFRGKHTEDDAFILTNGLDVPEAPTVEDVRKLIESDRDEK